MAQFFIVLKEKSYQTRNLHPAKISFRNEEDIKILSDKRKLRKSVVNRYTLKK